MLINFSKRGPGSNMNYINHLKAPTLGYLNSSSKKGRYVTSHINNMKKMGREHHGNFVIGYCLLLIIFHVGTKI